MKESLHEIHEMIKLRKFFPYVVLAIFLSLAIFVWLFWSSRDAAKEQLRYDEQTKIIASKITDRFHHYAMVLQGFSGLFTVSEDVTRNEWRAYYEYRQVQTFFPGVQGIGFSMVVQPSELSHHIQGIRAEGFPDYTVRPEGKRDVYTAIIFLEPFDVRNQRAFGYDMFSESVRRAAMERARDTGAVSLSGKVTLVQEIGEKVQAGFLLYVPIYEKGVPLNTTEERRAALIGYVYSPFRMNNLMQGIFPDSLNSIEFEIYDGTEVSSAGLMYECNENPITPDEKHKPMFSSQQTLDFYGHQWTLHFESRPPFEAAVDQYTSWGILAAGLVISLLIFFFIRGQESRVMRRTEELNMTQKMLKAAFDYSPIGKALVALDGRFMGANDMLCRILGYTKEELLIKTFQELTHPDDLEADLAYVNLLLAGKINEYEMEKRYLHKQGQFVWAQLNVSMVQDSDRQPLFFIAQIQDISRRKENDEKLRESESRFRDIAQSMADWIWEVDKNGKYTYVSDSVKNILGYTPEEILGKTPFEFMPEKEAAKIKEIFFESVSKSGPIVDLENWNLAKDGTEICLITNGVPLLNTDREFTGYRGVDKNITNQKKLETQVQQAQKMEVIGTLAGGIAHDFNNILSPILGHTELLLMDTPEDSPSIGNLKAINTAALRAKDLVRQILTFSRQDSSELILMKMQPIIKEALKLIRSTIPTTIEIQQDINPDGGIIRADPTQIHQIIMNLTTNAYHAMKKTGGELRVGLKEIKIHKQDVLSQIMEPGVYACLTIADTGIGMNKELTEKIFDPFFTTKKPGKGTGMGLSVVHGIVNKMGGTIRVYSEPGKGSEFKVYFPVDKRYSEEQKVQPKEPIPCGNEQILLVDDEEPILTMEKQVLERLGYQVTSRTSSLEALEAFRANPDRFDLVITDTAMPNMPGDKLSGELIKIRPDIPILLCTGFSKTMSEEKAASLGINPSF